MFMLLPIEMYMEVWTVNVHWGATSSRAAWHTMGSSLPRVKRLLQIHSLQPDNLFGPSSQSRRNPVCIISQRSSYQAREGDAGLEEARLYCFLCRASSHLPT